MPKIYLFFVLVFISRMVSAQEQISQFPSQTTTNPQSFQLIDTVNNHVLFQVYSPADSISNRIWVSDGTAENTHWLDSSGNFPNYLSNKVRVGNRLYLHYYNDGLWETDGKYLTKLLNGWKQPESVYAVDDKLLLYYTYYGSDISNSDFGWLDSTGNANIWQKNVYSFQVYQDVLFYTSYNTTAKQWEVYQYANGQKILLYTVAGTESTNFDRNQLQLFYAHETYFCYLTINGQNTLLRVPQDQPDAVTVFRFGNSFTIGWWQTRFILDETENAFLMRMPDQDVSIYSLQNDNYMEVILKGSQNDIFKLTPRNPSQYTPNVDLTGVKLNGTKLIFTSAVGVEGYYGMYINDYNFPTKQSRLSRNFLKNPEINPYGNFYHNISQLKVLSADEYLLDNKQGKLFTYNIETDSLWQSGSYPPPVPIEQKSIHLNDKTVLITDNLYFVSATDTVPYFEKKQIFTQSNWVNYAQEVNGKLVFLNYNAISDRNEVWATEGTAETTLKLLQPEGSFYLSGYYQSTMVLNNKLYFLTGKNGILYVYSTDGTTAGTKKIGVTTDGSFAGLYATKEHVYCRFQKQLILLSEDGLKPVSGFPDAFSEYNLYQTDTDLFVKTTGINNNYGYEQLFMVKGDKLTLVDEWIKGVAPFADRLYYAKAGANDPNNSESEVYYKDNTNDKKLLYSGKFDTFFREGNKLLLYQSGPYIYETTCTVFDLPSNTKEALFTRANISNVMAVKNGGVVFWGYNTPKITVLRGRTINDYVITDAQSPIPRHIAGVSPYGKGFLLFQSNEGASNYQFATYFDLEQNVQVPIVENGSFFPYPAENADEFPYFLYLVQATTDIYVLHQWNCGSNTVQALPTNNNYYGVTCNGLFSSKAVNGFLLNDYWRFKENKLQQQYTIASWPQRTTDKSFYFITTENTLYGIGQDSLLTMGRFPGNSGLSVSDIVPYNQQRYAFAFTYEKGFQLYRLPQWSAAKETALTPACPSGLCGDLGEGNGETTADNNLLFPNPASSNIIIESATGMDYRIYDTAGREIMTGSMGKGNSIEIGGLPRGTYLIKFQGGSKVFTKRFVKL